MDAEVTALAGPKGKHDADRATTRHGTEAGSVTLCGRRVPVRRPRVRRRRRARGDTGVVHDAGGHGLLAEGIVARMLAGISPRRYPVALEPVGSDVEPAAHATSKSAV